MTAAELRMAAALRKLTRVSNRWLGGRATDAELAQAQRKYTLASNAALDEAMQRAETRAAR